MKNKGLRITAAVWLISGWLWVGCAGSMPPNYYTLSPMEIAGAGGEMRTPALEALKIGVGPIRFPEALDRQHIVTRSGQNRLKINEYQRWGGSLESNFKRVLVENLSLLLGTDLVIGLPWGSYFEPDYKVVIEVSEFDGRLGKSATLNATWMIVGKTNNQPLLVRRTIIQEAVSQSDYDSLVAALSQTAAALSREIAKGLAGLPAARP